MKSQTGLKASERNSTDNNKEVQSSSDGPQDKDNEVASGEEDSDPTDFFSSQATSLLETIVTPLASSHFPQIQENVSTHKMLSQNSIDTVSSPHLISDSLEEFTDNSTIEVPLLAQANHTQVEVVSQLDDTPSSLISATIVNAKHNSDTQSPEEKSMNSSALNTVTSINQVDQSAMAISPPTVNVATSHFTPIEEEEVPGKNNTYIFGLIYIFTINSYQFENLLYICSKKCINFCVIYRIDKGRRA